MQILGVFFIGFLPGFFISTITMACLGVTVVPAEVDQLTSTCSNNQGLRFATMSGFVEGDNTYRCVNGAEFHLPNQQVKD